MDLFNTETSTEDLCIPGAQVTLVHRFLGQSESGAVFSTLIQETPWQQDYLHIANRKIPVPRLQAWYGDADSLYGYSGLRLSPLPWTALLLSLKEQIARASAEQFNSVLVNYYRNGHDSVSWHADDEPELGEDPVIASLSLGVSRLFQLKSKNPPATRLDCSLDDGSLLIMGKGTQINWQHRIPKQDGLEQPRINLTFRRILPPE